MTPAQRRRAALAVTARRAATLAARRIAVYGWSAAGLTLLSAAAWHAHTIAGLAAAGTACLIMEWRVRGT
jgi:dienelactone hydrolase